MIAQESDTVLFFLYFLGSCFVICVTLIGIFFCFSGRSCIIICYIFCNKPDQQETNENTPQIVDSTNFPRPGFDGYCLILRQENSHNMPLQEELCFSCSIGIDRACVKHAAGGLEPHCMCFPREYLAKHQWKGWGQMKKLNMEI